MLPKRGCLFKPNECTASLTLCPLWLQSLFPGLGAGTPAGVTYGVRCWTTWNRGFSTGAVTVTPSANNPVAYLGGLQIYGSGSPALAPNMTTLGSYYQFLSVDWFNVTVTTVLNVKDNGVPLPIDLISMRLPIGGIADGVAGLDLVSEKGGRERTQTGR